MMTLTPEGWRQAAAKAAEAAVTLGSRSRTGRKICGIQNSVGKKSKAMRVITFFLLLFLYLEQ